MSIRSGECQICKKLLYPDDIEKSTEAESASSLGFQSHPDFIKSLPYALQPDSKYCCSYPCLHSAIMANGAWRLKENLRRLSNASFDTFQDIFAFGVDGGYAKNMFELARSSPILFMYRLDSNNFLRLVNGKL